MKVTQGLPSSSQPLEIRFGLPFFKTDGLFAQDQEIGGVVVALHLLPGFVQIAQFEGVRLIIEFEYVGVVIHDENGPQLHFLALKLNGDAHFPRRVHSAHVACTRRDATNGMSVTNGGERVTGRWRERERATPLLKG